MRFFFFTLGLQLNMGKRLRRPLVAMEARIKLTGEWSIVLFWPMAGGVYTVSSTASVLGTALFEGNWADFDGGKEDSYCYTFHCGIFVKIQVLILISSSNGSWVHFLFVMQMHLFNLLFLRQIDTKLTHISNF